MTITPQNPRSNFFVVVFKNITLSTISLVFHRFGWLMLLEFYFVFKGSSWTNLRSLQDAIFIYIIFKDD